MSDTTSTEELLSARGATLRFGGVVALNNVDFAIKRGEILGLIGPNGAGKTTLFNAITGVYQLTEGTIEFDGTRISGQRRHKITKMGIARTFQNIRLFPEMTALENVMVGADAHNKTGVLSSLLRLPRHWREEREGRNLSHDLLNFVGIKGRAGELARNLSYGEQRRLEIARALATDPKLILLDEPTAGMNPQETRQAEELIFRIRDLGLAVVVIEHDMRFIFNLCDRVLCLVQGKRLIEGTPAEVQSDPRVIEAYIGTGPADSEEPDPPTDGTAAGGPDA